MSRLHRVCLAVDRLSGATGLVGGALAIPLVLVMFYEVVLRSCCDLPTFWAYELAYMMTGAHFALGIGYVMRENRHVRVDFLYARFSPRAKAAIDGFVQTLFLAPVIVWMTYVLTSNAWIAFVGGEVSGESAWNPYVWPLYTAVAFGFAVFSAQVLVEVVRNLRVVIGLPALDFGAAQGRMEGNRESR